MILKRDNHVMNSKMKHFEDFPFYLKTRQLHLLDRDRAWVFWQAGWMAGWEVGWLGKRAGCSERTAHSCCAVEWRVAQWESAAFGLAGHWWSGDFLSSLVGPSLFYLHFVVCSWRLFFVDCAVFNSAPSPVLDASVSAPGIVLHMPILFSSLFSTILHVLYSKALTLTLLKRCPFASISTKSIICL